MAKWDLDKLNNDSEERKAIIEQFKEDNKAKHQEIINWIIVGK